MHASPHRSAAAVIIKNAEEPRVSATSLPRQYQIAAAGGNGYQAQLTLCYDDLELGIAGLSLTDEPSLHAYRYQNGTT